MATERPMKIDREKIKDRYQTTTVEVDGKKKRVTDNGDEVAVMMRGVAGDEQLREFAAKHGLADRLNSDWAHLNAGQQRMAVGNALRVALRRKKAAEAEEAAKAAA